MTGPDRLRPNEVAGTCDVDAINAVMRDALGDDWASVLVTWSDYLPPQDAPALGYHRGPLIGAEAVPDATPPTVTAADPVADLVKAYRLVRDHPEYP